jgi:hypothetical protein
MERGGSGSSVTIVDIALASHILDVKSPGLSVYRP